MFQATPGLAPELHHEPYTLETFTTALAGRAAFFVPTVPPGLVTALDLTCSAKTPIAYGIREITPDGVYLSQRGGTGSLWCSWLDLRISYTWLDGTVCGAQPVQAAAA